MQYLVSSKEERILAGKVGMIVIFIFLFKPLITSIKNMKAFSDQNIHPAM